MKKIIIIRHAKSSNPINISDFDRPLHKDGIDGLLNISQELKKKGVSVDLFIHSPAKRAKNSAAIIAENINYRGEMRIESDIYYGDAKDLFAIFRSLSESMETVVLVGHNPTLEEFCSQVSDSNSFYFQMSTSTSVCFSYPDSWEVLSYHSAHFEWIINA